MSAMTNSLEQSLGDHLFRDTAYTMEETYCGLYSDATTEAGGGTEIATGSYARVRIYTDTTTAPFWTAYAAGTYDNNSDVTFPTATASWGTVTNFALLNAVTVGTMLIHGTLTSSKTVDNNDTFKFATGDLDITLD
jgi:hypothetical protein